MNGGRLPNRRPPFGGRERELRVISVPTERTLRSDDSGPRPETVKKPTPSGGRNPTRGPYHRSMPVRPHAALRARRFFVAALAAVLVLAACAPAPTASPTATPVPTSAVVTPSPPPDAQPEPGADAQPGGARGAHRRDRGVRATRPPAAEHVRGAGPDRRRGRPAPGPGALHRRGGHARAVRRPGPPRRATRLLPGRHGPGGHPAGAARRPGARLLRRQDEGDGRRPARRRLRGRWSA